MTALYTGIQTDGPISVGNSINLHILRTDKFKTAVCCLLIRRPLSREESTKNAVLTEVLKQGSAEYPSIAKINGRMEELYGGVFDCQIVKKGEEQILQLYFEGVHIDGIISKGAEFLFEVILNPLTDGNAFRPEMVNNAKNNIKNAIEARINDKSEYARAKCLKHMCEGEPFAVYADGCAEDLADLNGENLYGHYLNILKTSPIELICAGNLDEDDLLPVISRMYIPGRAPVIIGPAVRKSARREMKTVTEDMGNSQSKVCIGLRADIEPASRQFFGLLMMNEILGGGANSKLFTKIREEQNLCYYIHSVLYRFKSIILVQTGVAAGSFDHILSAVNREVEDIRQGCVTKAEWDSAGQGLISKFRNGLDHLPAILDFYTGQYLLNEKKSVGDIITGIESITPDETAQAAASMRPDTAYELR